MPQKKIIYVLRWLHAYYIKGKPIETCYIPLYVSWMLRRVVNSRILLLECGGWSTVATPHKFSVAKAYERLDPVQNKVSWRGLIVDNKATSESTFTIWLMAH